MNGVVRSVHDHRRNNTVSWGASQPTSVRTKPGFSRNECRWPGPLPQGRTVKRSVITLTCRTREVAGVLRQRDERCLTVVIVTRVQLVADYLHPELALAQTDLQV